MNNPAFEEFLSKRYPDKLPYLQFTKDYIEDDSDVLYDKYIGTESHPPTISLDWSISVPKMLGGIKDEITAALNAALNSEEPDLDSLVVNMDFYAGLLLEPEYDIFVQELQNASSSEDSESYDDSTDEDSASYESTSDSDSSDDDRSWDGTLIEEELEKGPVQETYITVTVRLDGGREVEREIPRSEILAAQLSLKVDSEERVTRTENNFFVDLSDMATNNRQIWNSNRGGNAFPYLSLPTGCNAFYVDIHTPQNSGPEDLKELVKFLWETVGTDRGIKINNQPYAL